MDNTSKWQPPSPNVYPGGKRRITQDWIQKHCILGLYFFSLPTYEIKSSFLFFTDVDADIVDQPMEDSLEDQK